MHSSAPDVETVVVGAGVVGLAIGAELARRGGEVLVLERNDGIGQETSSRSSEVIHAGIYYPKDSLKARLCVQGRQELYRFAADNGVDVRRTGKLIVATSAEEERKLAQIRSAAAANGVDDLRQLSLDDVRDMEPQVSCTAALFSPSTGIIDSHGLMVALEGHLSTHGGSVVLATEVLDIRLLPNGLFEVATRGEGTMTSLSARKLVLSAGHGMADLARVAPCAAPYTPPALSIAKGHYFTLSRKAPFHHLIYPIPVDGGLGVHLTLDMQGQARFGPDVQWLDRIDYAFDDADGARRRQFAAAIQRYWPSLDADDLNPGYTGIRPKVSGPGEPAADFAIHGAGAHGIANMVALYGIESPGLTSSLAIAGYVADMLAA